MSTLSHEASASFHQSIVELNPFAVLVLSKNGQIREVNHAACELFGYTHKGFPMNDYMDFIVPEHRGTVRRHLETLIEGTSSSYEASACHKNGTRLDIHVTAIPLVNEGDLYGIFCLIQDITESNKERAAQVEREERLKAVFHSTSAAMFILDLDGHVADINAAFEETYGWKRDEMIGKPLPIIPQAFETRHQERVEQGRRGECCRGFETIGLKKDGTCIEVSSSFSPLRNENGEIIGIVGMTKDISVQNKLERSWKESEERYRKLVELSPEGIMVHREGEVLYANLSAMNYSKEFNPQGVSLYSFIPEEQHEMIRQRVNELKKGNLLPYMAIEVMRRDGQTIFIDTNSISITHEGQPAILTMFRDITQRSKVEAALKESEKRYRMLADNSLDLIQLVQLDGIVTYASPSHNTVLGYDPSEYVGNGVFYQPNGEVDVAFREVFVNMAITQRPFSCEIHRRHRLGYDVWVELIGTPMFDAEGTYANMMLVGREITERKKYEEHLEHLSYHDHLTELPNRRLFHALLDQAMLEAKHSKRLLAVMYIDLDGFKEINDNFGHDAGDELLRQLAQRVKSCLRDIDRVARMGGDEFVIALPNLDSVTEAEGIAEKILSSLQQPWLVMEHHFVSTSSIGVAFYQEDDKLQTLLKKADTALYQAKSDGKNMYRIYS
ncbi:PAS domain S-box protein [Paenibacillus gorillae]|uniref:PAS domain S-box protein n=1 Tax=Paenibacillus gorillae TaxID=1243662 RepID=UPI000694FBE0|nr:PAS domain S-box protein [Paenibacillus gorillae]